VKNSFGTSLTVTLFGESHGAEIGAVIDGIAPGIKVDNEYIENQLTLGRPNGRISTSRQESDSFRIVSGVFNGYTTGTPIAILIPNSDIKSKDYSKMQDIPRPGHADFTAYYKYHGFQDYRGGGHFSGRITAAVVAACAIVESALEKKGIYIGTHIKELHGVRDAAFGNYNSDISALNERAFPVLSDEAEAKMRELIERAASEGDSVGGILETAVIGLPRGVGEPWFDTLEGQIAHAIFSIPAVKGVEFGLGFGYANAYGSEANDALMTDGEKIYTATNNAGGICGGISNGMPIVFSTAVKPTPSIFKEQNTVSLQRMENTTLRLTGRHDPAIIHRVRAVVDAMTSLVIADMLVTRFGTDYLA
jgi:chorismate synthase